MQGLRSLAPAPSPAVAPKTLQAAAVRQAQTPPPSYTVQAGDTVSAIAARYGLRTPDVLALNNLSWRSVIHPGQVLSLGGTPAAPSSAPSAGGYTVQVGDTISAIARRHGLSTNAVLSANGLSWSSIIYPGQVLAIPGATTSGAAAQAPAPAPAPAPSPAPSGGGYTVVAGDTISAIAQRHGVTTDAVLGANGLNRSSIIYPGQTLTIPLAAVAASAPAVPGLDAEQVANAQLIVRIGRELGVPDRGIAIALGTAMQESWIRNLDWGDRDSLGLFQQRPSTGWGTEAEVRDAARSIRAFYGGASDPNGTRTRGLLDIPGWESMSFAEAAQAVQISAYPERYAQWEASAHAWLAALG
ncbi:MAG TPA: LysM peptidoglycan-binding domain-containing protein [Rhodoglobus sp.]|nr:LysM peptidoglycan-binding domain-containing protein [Rhodoglobus sp.]